MTRFLLCSPGGNTIGDEALDAWLQASLRASYQDTLAQPLPDAMLRLCQSELERHPGRKAA